MPGVRCSQRAVAIRRVGLYVPGRLGAPLFDGAHARRAARDRRCAEIVLCTPAGRDGSIAPEIRYAAALCGVRRVFALGGGAGVAAMAYGTESVPRVDKIFGPGNRYVTRAKQLVGAEGTAIDLPAGPSEVLVLADEGASPDFAAADLLSQAEHGGDSQAVLVCRTVAFARRVNDALRRQTAASSRNAILRESLAQSRIVVFDLQDDMLDFRRSLRPRTPDRLAARPVARRPPHHDGRQRLRGRLCPRKRRRLRLGDEPHAPHGRVRPRVQRREHRQLPAPHHLSGTHARRASRTRPDGRRHGPGPRDWTRMPKPSASGWKEVCDETARRTRPPQHPHARPLLHRTRRVRRPTHRRVARRQRKSLRQRRQPLSRSAPAAVAGTARRTQEHRRRPYLHRQRQRRGDRSGLPHLLPAGHRQRSLDRTDLRQCTASRRPSTTSNYAKCRSATDFSLPVERLLAAADERSQTAVALLAQQPHGATLFRRRRSNGCCAASTAWSSSTKPTSISPTGPDSLPRLDEFPNLIVLQTLSKAWGMAGLRIGLAFAAREVAALFSRVKYPYNIPGPTQRAAEEMLGATSRRRSPRSAASAGDWPASWPPAPA